MFEQISGELNSPGNATLRSGGLNSPGNATLRSGGLNSPGNATLRSGEEKEANREIGDLGESRWHSRGYLPHFDSAVAIQHVTFHLADSLPESVVMRLEQEIRCLPVEKQDEERRKRVDAWIDAGHGSCIMREPSIARIVQNVFLFFDGLRYRLLAWVVMPNHVHVLFQPINGWSVAKIVASWKKFTATRICALRLLSGDGSLHSGKEREANREIGGSGINLKPVWHREYWDRFIRDSRHYDQTVGYIHHNPIKAGLAATAEEWPWSSANYYGNATLRSGGLNFPGNATLRSGEEKEANREIGDPGLKSN